MLSDPISEPRRPVRWVKYQESGVKTSIPCKHVVDADQSTMGIPASLNWRWAPEDGEYHRLQNHHPCHWYHECHEYGLEVSLESDTIVHCKP
ncbi:hypothetical protein NPIL_696101 [Nephila pilipes]|uniref:Uncharacterized protein n=1 Tax=Nephila pilipes TaxID=299642 RepID=A0A8X6IVY7_NEPPI|nr:hypothetical protein NPIL_696101 [Nephila pilipes]